MRLLFVYWAFEDQGSGLVLQGYTDAARAMGHEVAVYGCWRLGAHNPHIPLNYSLDVASADAVVFLFEWTTALKPGDQLDLLRLVAQIPRERRVIIDGDGNYNDVVDVGADRNHANAESSLRWREVCDSLSDKICQPTLHPRDESVRPFLFYAYNPDWERPLDFGRKEFDMVYVGHSKYRWMPMRRVLEAIEPVRDRMGTIALVGHGWGRLPFWAEKMHLEEAYFTDADYLERLEVDIRPSVRFEEVIDWMSKATFSPVLLRPTFSHLRIVTPRMFETPAANTIPVFVEDETHVQEIYGEEALNLMLPDDDPEEKILDIVGCPERYTETVRSIRHRLAEEHSHAARLRRLLEIIES